MSGSTPSARSHCRGCSRYKAHDEFYPSRPYECKMCHKARTAPDEVAMQEPTILLSDDATFWHVVRVSQRQRLMGRF